ncbi:unnamed protein product [Penicillium glandicola]
MESGDHFQRTERPHSGSVSSLSSHDHFIESENSVNGDVQSSRALVEIISASANETHESPAESVADPKKGKNPTKDIFSTSISDWFIWEALAIVISLLLLIAIIIVLSRFNGHPQPTWEYVSLNSLISWLSTISKGCVLFAISEALGQLKWVWFTQKTRSMLDLRTFDGASRGFYGSGELIWSLRAKHFAVLGSLAVILALGFDPFTQNLIHYYSNLVTDVSQIASVSSTILYSVIGLDIHAGASWYVDPAFKANVYNSLLNSDSTKPWSIPQYTCSTGNCTWDSIAALELSSSCTDVTDQLKFVCYNNDTEFISIYGTPNCSVNLSGSTTSANFLSNKSDGYPVSIAYVASEEALIYKGLNHFTTQMIAPNGLVLAGPFELNKTKWQAMECSLFPTVRSFLPTVTNGIYHEKTLDTWTNSTFEYEPSPGYYLNPPWGPEMGMEHNQSFVLGSLSAAAMGWFFQDIFTGRAKISSLFGVTFMSSGDGMYTTTDVIQAISYGNITGCTDNTAERLRCAMENVAAAASKTFRDSVDTDSGAGNGTVAGQAKSSRTYITVHWQWIALPALVWLLGLTTVVGTMWKSRRGSVPKWKNDLIPLLFLYQNGQDESVSGEKMNDSLNVRLYKSDDRIVLGE